MRHAARRFTADRAFRCAGVAVAVVTRERKWWLLAGRIARHLRPGKENSVQQFKQLSLDMIEEGTLLEDLETAFSNIQIKLCEYRNKYGACANKSKAAVTLKINLECKQPQNDLDDALYMVTTEISSKVPTRPSKATVALQASDDDGQERLFARATGSSDDDPRQGILFKKDGTPVTEDDRKKDDDKPPIQLRNGG